MADKADTKAGAAGAKGSSETERAERLVEDWGARMGRFFAQATARTREEFEDIWAEAQSVRHGHGSTQSRRS